jgi:hypothetical protein
MLHRVLSDDSEMVLRRGDRHVLAQDMDFSSPLPHGGELVLPQVRTVNVEINDSWRASLPEDSLCSLKISDRDKNINIPRDAETGLGVGLGDDATFDKQRAHLCYAESAGGHRKLCLHLPMEGDFGTTRRTQLLDQAGIGQEGSNRRPTQPCRPRSDEETDQMRVDWDLQGRRIVSEPSLPAVPQQASNQLATGY